MSDNLSNIRKEFYSFLKNESQKNDSEIEAQEVNKLSVNKAAKHYKSEFRDFVKNQTALDEQDLVENSIVLEDEQDDFMTEMSENNESSEENRDK